MGKLQIEESFIKEKYKVFIKKSDLTLYKIDDKIYKIYKIYKFHGTRKFKEKYLPILEQNNFDYAINIEDIIYDNNGLIGSSTIYDADWKSFKCLISKLNLDVYDKKEIFAIMLSFVNELKKFDLYYTDFHLENIGLSQNYLKFLDLDGCEYCNNKADSVKLINKQYKNMYRLILSIILKLEDLKDIHYAIDDLYLKDINKSSVTKFISEYDEFIDNEIKNNFYKYQLSESIQIRKIK